jgi:type IV secretion system protein VirD4
VSDALGTATELRSMKNYAGHRLSPWLGHLMVSRQETARPLLTPGEVMQLPPAEELVLVSGCPPIRAQKVRYYEDKELAARVGAAAPCAPSAPPPDPWSGRKPIKPPKPRPSDQRKGAGAGKGGIDRERLPDLPERDQPPKRERTEERKETWVNLDGSLFDQTDLARQAATDPDSQLGL